ncbi:hypothetical protein GQ600_13209 [Phytophthora cactorum]|nr:hypothetical protein GQ600_13209 [Phytophthora cactorum]
MAVKYLSPDLRADIFRYQEKKNTERSSGGAPELSRVGWTNILSTGATRFNLTSPPTIRMADHRIQHVRRGPPKALLSYSARRLTCSSDISYTSTLSTGMVIVRSCVSLHQAGIFRMIYTQACFASFGTVSAHPTRLRIGPDGLYAGARGTGIIVQRRIRSIATKG